MAGIQKSFLSCFLDSLNLEKMLPNSAARFGADDIGIIEFQAYPIVWIRERFGPIFFPLGRFK